MSEWRDYSAEIKLITSKPLRILLIAVSTVALGLGILGIFLPLLPTTPFLLLAAACYARSSPRFYNWLMNHRQFGPPLRRWREQRAISKGHKILALSMLALTLIPAILFWVPVLAVKILLAAIGLGVAGFILRQPHGPAEPPRGQAQS